MEAIRPTQLRAVHRPASPVTVRVTGWSSRAWSSSIRRSRRSSRNAPRTTGSRSSNGRCASA
ncbi:MAG: hypothetical protein R3C32_07020 [Chloroflexota bacterium]